MLLIIAVNNVGVSPGYPGPVFTSSSEKLWHVINVNIGAATQLCRHFVDHWYRTGQKGCIVNISSGLEVQPCPNGAVYAASKAYIRSFTLALQHEVEPLGITVQLVSPNLVATKINSYSSSIMKGSLMIPTADEYAQSAVKTIGKTTVTTGYVWHAIQVSLIKEYTRE